jgi:hypothetical protein
VDRIGGYGWVVSVVLSLVLGIGLTAGVLGFVESLFLAMANLCPGGLWPTGARFILADDYGVWRYPPSDLATIRKSRSPLTADRPCLARGRGEERRVHVFPDPMSQLCEGPQRHRNGIRQDGALSGV